LRGANFRSAFFVLKKLAQNNPRYGLPLIADVSCMMTNGTRHGIIQE